MEFTDVEGREWDISQYCQKERATDYEKMDGFSAGHQLGRVAFPV